MTAGIRGSNVLMAALVTIAIIAFTVQSILASDLEVAEPGAGNEITGNAVVEMQENAEDNGTVYETISKASSWVFGG